ncbi:MAG TPA: CAP domain-containing protein [Tepidisphaeraceae bacterium]|nr:CAP domain-containing protein [Tepidisphaeraceae bacterium]
MPRTIEPLEPRTCFAATYPTALEQYALELINRARSSPATEAARLNVDLNEGLPAGTISTSAKQPLAFNPYLVDAARKHAQWMLDANAFGHTGANGSDPKQRMESAGYAFQLPWTWAENVALRSRGKSTPATVAAMHADLFIDFAIPDRGHRLALLAAQSKEVGLGLGTGLFNGSEATAMGQSFASSGAGSFLTGVVYTDTVKDRFYTPGEGLKGVTITATRAADGAAFSAKTWTSGGYSLPLAPGTYSITATGGALTSPIAYSNVTIGSENVKRDFVPTAAPTTPPKPTKLPDTLRPGAKVTQAIRKRTASRYYGFTVTYTDSVAIHRATLGDADVQVRGPGNFARDAVLVSIDRTANAKSLTATYAVLGPDKTWDRSDNGDYTVWVNPGQVTDTAGNSVRPLQIGTFSVKVIPTATPQAARLPDAPARNPVLDA